jgi:hypothetical protein
VNRNGEKPRRPGGQRVGETFEAYYCRLETYFRATQTERERVGYVADVYDVTRETVRCWVNEGCNIFRIDLTHQFASFKKSRRRSNRDETKRHRQAPRSPY